MRDAARQRGDETYQKRQKAFASPCIFATRLAGILYLVTATTSALARPADPIALIGGLRQSQDIIGLSFIVGLALFSTITALLHLRERHQWSKQEAAFQLDLTNLRARIDRADVFLAAEPQIIVAWDGPGG